jgi:FkbH-like protein
MDPLLIPWLPEPVADFRRQVRSLGGTGDRALELLRKLATARLNVNQLHTLTTAVSRLEGLAPSAWTSVAVLSNASTDMIASALPATGLRHQLLIKVQTAAYGMHTQEALNPVSETNTARNDFVLLALDHRAFDFRSPPADEAAAESKLAESLKSIRSLVGALHSHGGATVIVQTLAPPRDAYFGNLEGQLKGTLRWYTEQFNTQLRAERLPGTLLLDVATIASEVGTQRWHDPTQWVSGKFPFAHAFVPLYAEHLCRLLMAARGKAKKCLVLDLDNTLWGGVVGDDGLEGIVLGNGSPLGEAYLSVQTMALELRARGVVLAVCSKNDESLARRVFREHPEMLLREEHIAAFQANWKDKASNLRVIAATLNLGVDSLVLLDDNPAERQQVRMELPMVGVPELPGSPELFPATLLAAGYFEAVNFTEEDRLRAGQYQQNAARAAALDSESDLTAYLESLQMEATVSPFDATGRARIAQLINKTNQFNLTTRRYSESDIYAFEKNPDVFTLQVRLRDRLGDDGMVSVVICKPERDDRWRIDTWLMSCRVLKRGLEQAVLNIVMASARARGVKEVIGEYRPTERNGLVRDHYERLGFNPLVSEESAKLWIRRVNDYAPLSVPIRISGTDPT